MKTAGDAPNGAKPVAKQTLGGLIGELGGAMKTAGDSPYVAKPVARQQTLSGVIGELGGAMHKAGDKTFPAPEAVPVAKSQSLF